MAYFQFFQHLHSVMFGGRSTIPGRAATDPLSWFYGWSSWNGYGWGKAAAIAGNTILESWVSCVEVQSFGSRGQNAFK
jgi:hypothetical protein